MNCKKYFLSHLYIFFISLTLNIVVAQNVATKDSLEEFVTLLNEVNAILTKPLGLKDFKIIPSYQPLSNSGVNILNRFSFSNLDSSIVVNIDIHVVRDFDDKFGSKIVNDNYYRAAFPILNIRDLSKKYAKKITNEKLSEINVDNAIIYDYPPVKPFLSTYKFMKVLVLHKQDIGDVSLYYLTKDSASLSRVDSLIDNTWGMIKFLPDSTFKPTAILDDLIGKFYYMRPLSAQKILTDSAYNAQFVLENGFNYLRNRDYETARDYFDRANALRKNSVNPVFYTVVNELILTSDGTPINNDRIASHILDNSYMEKEVSLLLVKGMIFDIKNETDSCILCYKKSLILEPNNDLALSSLHRIYLHKGDIKSIIEMYSKAQMDYSIKNDKESPYYNYQIGKLYLEQNPPNK